MKKKKKRNESQQHETINRKSIVTLLHTTTMDNVRLAHVRDTSMCKVQLWAIKPHHFDFLTESARKGIFSRGGGMGLVLVLHNRRSL